MKHTQAQFVKGSRAHGILWAALFHIYQPDHWDPRVIRRVAKEAYYPLLRMLQKNPKHKITLNICGSLSEQLSRYGMSDLLRGFAACAERGQVEFTQTAKYHPILPKLPRKEIIRQFELNYATNRAFFGEAFAPRGVFLPEMCVNHKVASIVAELGYQWLVLDEITYSGRIGDVSFRYKYFEPKSKLFILFRNRIMSDVFFRLDLNTVNEFRQFILEKLGPRSPLITALDGENLGHHRKDMDTIYRELVGGSTFVTQTYSELLATLPPKNLSKNFRASSWASRSEELARGVPYIRWDDPNNPIHKLLWEITLGTLKIFYKYEAKTSLCGEARIRLDQALNSDQYWWASTQPWWSVEILFAALDEWKRVLSQFSGVPQREILKIMKLITRAKHCIRTWQDKGIADRRRLAYLRTVQEASFLGGKTVL